MRLRDLHKRLPLRDGCKHGAALGCGVLLYVLSEPVLSLVRELGITALVLSMHAVVAGEWWRSLVLASGLDPVYTGAGIRSLGSMDVQGIAVVGPLGAMLHAYVPVLFAAPDRVTSGAFTSVVVTPGGSVLEHGLVTFAIDLAILVFGILCVKWSAGRIWLAAFGMLVQAHIVLGHLLTLELGARDLDASGLPFAISLLAPSAGWVLTDSLARLPRNWQGASIGSVLVIVAYVLAVASLGMAGWIGRRIVVTRTSARPGSGAVSRSALAASAMLGLAAWLSPLGHWAHAAPNWRTQAPQPAVWTPMPRSPSMVATTDSGFSSAPVVRVVRDAGGHWKYQVDGTAQVIRGIGYNADYAGLSRAQRADMYQRDFSEIRSAGANTIEGWFDEQFDELTLDYAERNGLGVILPYRLSNDLDYADPDVQRRVLDDVSTWVRRYRDSPALRMWAPGNENLHRMLYSKWVSQDQLPEAGTRAQAFATFLPHLIDRIHELDPDHPVLYRDAEDAYLGWLQQGFAQSPGDRPWFVYGANVYSRTRLGEIIREWPSQWPGGALLISEFAPAGSAPQNRALGYAQDWQQIRAHPGLVLGGLAYAWSVNGPEEVDRVFGLVDADGKPCDGALAGLAAAFQGTFAAQRQG